MTLQQFIAYLVALYLIGSITPLNCPNFQFSAKFSLFVAIMHNMKLKILHLAEKNAFLYDHVQAKLVSAKEILTRTAVNGAFAENSDKTVLLDRGTGINT